MVEQAPPARELLELRVHGVSGTPMIDLLNCAGSPTDAGNLADVPSRGTPPAK